jgi:hypothetical protein
MPQLFLIGTKVIYRADGAPDRIGTVCGRRHQPYQEIADEFYVSFPEKPVLKMIHKSFLLGIEQFNLKNLKTTDTIEVTEGRVCPISHEPFVDGQEIVELEGNPNFIFDRSQLQAFWSLKKYENQPMVNPLTNLPVSDLKIRVCNASVKN